VNAESQASPAPPAADGGGTAPAYQYVLAFLVALIGGALGIMGAVVQEIRAGGLILLPFVGAPIIEEALKPIGVYIALLRWPRALSSQLFTALLAASAGVVFGVIESTIYVSLYVKDYPDWYLAFRFSVPIAVHATASYIVGLGIKRGVLDWMQGRGPLPKDSRNYFIGGVALHAIYNVTAVSLVLAGPLDF